MRTILYKSALLWWRPLMMATTVVCTKSSFSAIPSHTFFNLENKKGLIASQSQNGLYFAEGRMQRWGESLACWHPPLYRLKSIQYTTSLFTCVHILNFTNEVYYAQKPSTSDRNCLYFTLPEICISLQIKVLIYAIRPIFAFCSQ